MFICLIVIGKCPILGDPDNGMVLLINDKMTAVFTCNSGFTTIGEAVLNCNNGKWNYDPPKCVSPSEVVNKKN